MSGIAGGHLRESTLREMLDGLTDRESLPTWRHEYGDFGVGIRYDSVDPGGASMWSDGTRAGVVFGAITNLDELEWTLAEFFQRLLDRPADTAAAVEGGFVVACYDPTEDRQLLVTDKLGVRPVFFTEHGQLYYATALDVLLPFLSEPSLDHQAASDMLLMGHPWGDHTLAEGIKALRPATVLEVVGTDRSFTRYWKPDYTELDPGEEYVTELVRRYRQAVERASRTLPSEAGIWLSGGLDSRTTAAALMEQRSEGGFETLRGYVYNANPPTNDNPRIAGQVAQELGIELDLVPLTAETVGRNFERILDATDGMLRWNTAANLSTTFSLKHVSPVMMEGMQGELVGDHPYRHHLTDFPSAVESQLSSEGETSPELVQRILNSETDPLGSFKEEADHSPETSTHGKVMDVHFQNYYSRSTMVSNRLMRERGGSRVVQADGDYLEWCAKLPRSYRKGAFPIASTPDGGIPYGTSRGKLALARTLSPQLTDIPYERTKVKPSWPYPAHVAGFVGNVVVSRLRQKPTYGNGQLSDFWIRDTDSLVHEYVTDLVDDARSRSLFDGDVVLDIYDDHMDGANRASILGQITTLEYWIQHHLD